MEKDKVLEREKREKARGKVRRDIRETTKKNRTNTSFKVLLSYGNLLFPSLAFHFIF